ncbi:hypothetical protein [Shewanella woodyi]|uniref:hypothetical protein n=1 Tax=Shewanella woodyi TaxID=60961 RepID=UPI0037492DDF
MKFDYLFAEYTYHFGDETVGLRGGLFKNEAGFYSSTRDVPFTRPSIMLPQSIYSDYFRDAQLHIEGEIYLVYIRSSMGHWIGTLLLGKWMLLKI